MSRILIIEDDDLLRKVLAKTLELAGHTVLEASNGQEGLDLFRGTSADLVITDLVMPVKEGVETIMQLHREFPDLPILAMSGGVPNSGLYLNIANKIGAQRVLAKPFTPQELMEVVGQVLGNSQPSNPAP
jgi:CheY-like chemotaxis protein